MSCHVSPQTRTRAGNCSRSKSQTTFPSYLCFFFVFCRLSPMRPLDTSHSPVSPLFPLDTRKQGGTPPLNALVVPFSLYSVLALSPLFPFHFQLVPFPIPIRLHSILFYLYHFPRRTEKQGEGGGPHSASMLDYPSSYIINFGRRADIPRASTFFRGSRLPRPPWHFAQTMEVDIPSDE
jgi:hypothetical protein